MIRLQKKWKVTAIVFGMVIGLAAVANAENWAAWFGLYNTSKVRVQHAIGTSPSSPDGPLTTLEVIRGPLSSGTVTLQATVTIQATNLMSAMTLDVANDADSSGTIEASEWTTVATGTITESGGVTTGTTTTVSVSAGMDAYRVTTTRSDFGFTYDAFGTNGKAID